MLFIIVAYVLKKYIFRFTRDIHDGTTINISNNRSSEQLLYQLNYASYFYEDENFEVVKCCGNNQYRV